ncbi:YhcH/YjgK/YiaL family protein, partial [Mycoplasmopsis synoviae]|uniref:YhcH/YjgK/YiaL family protein n=1 Tax=Mycoplasmopsis synoviae TaxID=2109 RepID=UPI00387A9A9A
KRKKFYYLYENKLTHKKNDYSQKNDVQLFELPNERNLLVSRKYVFLLFLPKEGHVPKYISSRDKFKKFVLKIQW